MWMHTKYGFVIFWDLLLEDPVEIFKVSRWDDVFPHQFDKSLRSTKGVTHDHDDSFNSNDLTVESQKCIKSDSYCEKEWKLETKNDSCNCYYLLVLAKIFWIANVLFRCH